MMALLLVSLGNHLFSLQAHIEEKRQEARRKRLDALLDKDKTVVDQMNTNSLNPIRDEMEEYKAKYQVSFISVCSSFIKNVTFYKYAPFSA